MAEGCKSHPFR
jgi:hypothetical protein